MVDTGESVRSITTTSVSMGTTVAVEERPLLVLILEAGSLADTWFGAETAPAASAEALTKEDVVGSIMGLFVVPDEFEVARRLE